jgi:hypothetical protein
MPRATNRYLAACEGVISGLLMAALDINSEGKATQTHLLAYLAAGRIVGFRHKLRAWQAWPGLGLSLYLVHLVAIMCGYRQPYVEADMGDALGCLIVVFPAGFGLGLGTLLRLGVDAVGKPELWAASRPKGRFEHGTGFRSSKLQEEIWEDPGGQTASMAGGCPAEPTGGGEVSEIGAET